MIIEKNNRKMFLLYQTTIGSRAYGTHIEEDTIINGVNFKKSDFDSRGICVPLDDNLYYGLHEFEQDNNKNDDGEENPIYSIKKFFRLASNNNPNLLEMLFIDDPKLNTHVTDIWEDLIKPNRNMFLSKKCKHAYKGYAMAQMKRIQNHRKWLSVPPEKPNSDNYFFEPKEKYDYYKGIYLDYDKNMPGMKERLYYWIDNLKEIPDSVIYVKTHGKKILFRYKHDQREKQGMLFDQVKYDEDVKTYSKYTSWRENRNDARFKYEAVMGYDTKHGSHVHRLLDQAIEILEDGTLTVNNPEKSPYWKDIRFMKVPYEEFISNYEAKINLLDTLEANSTLQKIPPINKIEQICIDVTKKVLGL